MTCPLAPTSTPNHSAMGTPAHPQPSDLVHARPRSVSCSARSAARSSARSGAGAGCRGRAQEAEEEEEDVDAVASPSPPPVPPPPPLADTTPPEPQPAPMRGRFGGGRDEARPGKASKREKVPEVPRTAVDQPPGRLFIFFFLFPIFLIF